MIVDYILISLCVTQLDLVGLFFFEIEKSLYTDFFFAFIHS